MKRSKPTYERLKKTWEKRLEKEGLADIEDGRHRLVDHQTLLRLYTYTGFQSTESMLAIRDYYIWAEQCLTLCRFKEAVDRQIWRFHAEGRSTREITALSGVPQRDVCRRISKIRAYLQAQTGKSEWRIKLGR